MDENKIYILIVKNRLKYSLEDDLAKLNNWLLSVSPLELEYDFLESDLDISYKDFGVKINDVSFFGVDGLKEKLRSLKIEPNEYHSIFFLYENTFTGNNLGAWTYPNPLNESEVVIEIPSTALWESSDNLFRMMSHELLHAFHRLCWWQGIATYDSMDKYDKEMDVFAKDGNRARNILALSAYWDKIANLPKAKLIKYILEKIKELYTQVLAILLLRKSRIETWALAIKEYEGWFEGSRSFRNNNPGNLKFAGQSNAINADSGGFAIFKTYEDGWKALINQLDLACSGKSLYYKPDMNLFEFFTVFAPAHDNNEPNAYALFVARKLGVDPAIKIKELI